MSNYDLAIKLGALSGILFVIANFHVLLTHIKKAFWKKDKWTWLDSTRKTWNYIHFIGNALAVITLIVHTFLLWLFPPVLIWVLIIFLVFMVIGGFVIRFTKVNPQFKKTLRNYHTKGYMLIISLVLLILAMFVHSFSLSFFK